MGTFLFSSFLIHYSFSAFILSLFLTLISIKEKFIPKRYSNDLISGSQKIHQGRVKRIGGLPIILSIFFILLYEHIFVENKYSKEINSIFFFCVIIFIIGFLEDLIKDIKPSNRLIILFIATFSWLIYSNNLITNTNIDFIDHLIEIKTLSLILTLICIISSLNASNMMDGANGLLTIFAISVFTILACYAYNHNDDSILKFLYILIGSLIGFLIFNWPRGIIFLGDGGSYFIGAILSTLLIFISNYLNNFNMLNALIIMIYPIWELFFTIFRRMYSSSKITNPDNLHLHTILHANLKKLNFTKKYNLNDNAWTGVIINVIALFPSIIFLLINNDKNLEDVNSITFFIILFCAYTILYSILNKRNKTTKRVSK